MPNPLSQHDYVLLDVAVRCVSQFNVPFAREIWDVSAVATKRRLAKLEKRGLIKSRKVLASQPPPINKPLCIWKPGEALPNSGKVAYQARNRWKTLPVEVQRIYYASDLGRGLLGRGILPRPKDIQATNDLGLALTFLAYRRRWPKVTQRCWLNESEYSSHRGRCVKVEDAMLKQGDRVMQMIDFAGAYRPDRVQALLEHAQYHHVPISIF